ncbi:MAG TPA: hypothetical protein VFB82_20100 [Blastocatellia bacterium]|nr:hypothetical protein [Blastocatellia bacterium]
MKQPAKQFALCLENQGNEASLILGKVTESCPIREQQRTISLVDESGEDYVFHKSQFAFVDAPLAVRKKILALQQSG